MSNRHITKIAKGITLVLNKNYRRGLSLGVAAAIEHEAVIKATPFNTLIDIGANIGQFSLLVRGLRPDAKIVAFEPLSQPGEKYKALFADDNNASLIPTAIGSQSVSTSMHVSKSIDSSSLLEISETQSDIFPGTHEVGVENVTVGTLSEQIDMDGLQKPIFMKIDVQGYEKEVLMGCKDVLGKIDLIYIECSFVELYVGQALVTEIFGTLVEENYWLKGVYNMTYDGQGKAVQGDFLFVRNKSH